MGHRHRHAPVRLNRIFALAVVLNLGFVIAEATFGILADSLALLADAGHNLSDVMGLLIAWGGSALGQKAASTRHTYGFGRASIIAALANALLLMVAVGAIAWEAIGRFSAPVEVAGMTVVIVAAIGVAINLGTAALFFSGRHRDLNFRGAFLHMAADAAVSLAVVVSGLAMAFTGAPWIDPAMSLCVAVVIALTTWGLFRESLSLAMDGVPEAIDTAAVRSWLASLAEVEDVHDLHIWALSTTETALTAHLVTRGDTRDHALLDRINHELGQRFGVTHVTIQLEAADARFACDLAERCQPG